MCFGALGEGYPILKKAHRMRSRGKKEMVEGRGYKSHRGRRRRPPSVPPSLLWSFPVRSRVEKESGEMPKEEEEEKDPETRKERKGAAFSHRRK